MTKNKPAKVAFLRSISRYESKKVSHALCMAGFEILPAQCVGIAGDILRRLTSDYQTEKELRQIIAAALV